MTHFVKILFFVGSIIFCITNGVNAQNTEDKIFALDADWKGTDLKNAHYLLRIKKLNDSSWQWDTYNILGPVIKTESFKDPDGNVAEGEFYFYNSKGRIDSMHTYANGLAQGEWYYYNDTGRACIKKVFSNGKLIEVRDFIKEDSMAKLMDDENDSIEDGEEIESEFPGRAAGWQKYLKKNFNYPERAINNKVEGLVIVQFIVDAKGYVTDPRIFKSVEFSLDEEALRLIRQSPQWIPAEQNGRKVKSYKRQPVQFQLE